MVSSSYRPFAVIKSGDTPEARVIFEKRGFKVE
jgi:hypothetical protein